MRPELAVEPQPGIRLVLVQALAKGDRDELATETATELGIDAVIPWQSERSIVRWKGDRAAKAHAKWQSVVTAAAKQARRAWIPEVRSVVDTGAGLAKAGRGRGPGRHPARRRQSARCGTSSKSHWRDSQVDDDGTPREVLLHRGSGGRDQPAGGNAALRRRRRHGTAGPPRAAVVDGGSCRRRAGQRRSGPLVVSLPQGSDVAGIRPRTSIRR